MMTQPMTRTTMPMTIQSAMLISPVDAPRREGCRKARGLARSARMMAKHTPPSSRNLVLGMTAERLRQPGSVVRPDELSDQREHLQLPALAAEDAVMAGAGLQVMALHVGLEAGEEVVRRHRLPHGTDVVALAFDREQRGASDQGRVD